MRKMNLLCFFLAEFGKNVKPDILKTRFLAVMETVQETFSHGNLKFEMLSHLPAPYEHIRKGYSFGWPRMETQNQIAIGVRALANR